MTKWTRDYHFSSLDILQVRIHHLTNNPDVEKDCARSLVLLLSFLMETWLMGFQVWNSNQFMECLGDIYPYVKSGHMLLFFVLIVEKSSPFQGTLFP